MLKTCTTDVVSPLYPQEKYIDPLLRTPENRDKEAWWHFHSPKAKCILLNLWKKLKPNSAKAQLEKNPSSLIMKLIRNFESAE